MYTIFISSTEKILFRLCARCDFCLRNLINSRNTLLVFVELEFILVVGMMSSQTRLRCCADSVVLGPCYYLVAAVYMYVLLRHAV